VGAPAAFELVIADIDTFFRVWLGRISLEDALRRERRGSR
jgi:hypothetical protein